MVSTEFIESGIRGEQSSKSGITYESYLVFEDTDEAGNTKRREEVRQLRFRMMVSGSEYSELDANVGSYYCSVSEEQIDYKQVAGIKDRRFTELDSLMSYSVTLNYDDFEYRLYYSSCVYEDMFGRWNMPFISAREAEVKLEKERWVVLSDERGSERKRMEKPLTAKFDAYSTKYEVCAKKIMKRDRVLGPYVVSSSLRERSAKESELGVSLSMTVDRTWSDGSNDYKELEEELQPYFNVAYHDMGYIIINGKRSDFVCGDARIVMGEELGYSGWDGSGGESHYIYRYEVGATMIIDCGVITLELPYTTGMIRYLDLANEFDFINPVFGAVELSPTFMNGGIGEIEGMSGTFDKYYFDPYGKAKVTCGEVETDITLECITAFLGFTEWD